MHAHRFEVLEQRRPVEVGRAIARRDDVVAVQGADRDRVHRGALQDVVEVVHDLVEDVLIEVHQVHLVDGQHEVANAEQPRNARVPARLSADAVAGVHEQDGDVGRGRAGSHVARVLLVAGRVGQDELAARRGEVALARRRS